MQEHKHTHAHTVSPRTRAGRAQTTDEGFVYRDCKRGNLLLYARRAAVKKDVCRWKRKRVRRRERERGDYHVGGLEKTTERQTAAFG